MSVTQARLSEAAAVDINEQADWYEEKSDQKLAARWSKAVTSAVLRILKNPRSGRRADSARRNCTAFGA